MPSPSTTHTAQPRALLVAADGDVALSFDYDGFLTTSQTTGTVDPQTVTWQYDTSFRITRQDAGGSEVAYTYDDDDRLLSVGDQAITRDPATGKAATRTLGDVTITYTYDGYGALTRTHAVFDDGVSPALELFDEQITRDALGRVDTRDEEIEGAPAVTWDYDYDAVGRLSDVSQGAVTRTYSYDLNGNLTAGPGGAGVYDDRDRLEQYGSATYTNDSAGDLASIADGGSVTDIEIDAAGLLVSVDVDGTETTYTYDGLDRRVGRAVDGTLERSWIYHDGNSPVVELDDAGDVALRFVPGITGDTPDYIVDGSDSHLVVSDWRGSPRLVVDTTDGSIVQRLDYDELGAITSDSNPGYQPFGYRGGLVDADTGFVRFGLRDYDPSVGRFTSRDPILFDGGQTNLYVFANGDPVNGSDPTGAGPENFRTYSLGGEVSGSFGPFAGSLNISLAYDTGGDFGIQITPSSGVGAGAGADGSIAFQSNKGTIRSNIGVGDSVTADGGAGFNAGGAVNLNPETGEVAGYKIKAGAGAGGGASLERGYTGAITKDNVTDAVTSVGEWMGL